MPEVENRSASNLIVLCLEHASEIDDHSRVADFPVSLLLEWKRKQLDEFDSLGHGGWNLSDSEASEVAESSIVSSSNIQDSVVSLGGEGGKAPGSGGGGGGVIGPGAAGGKGGDGGNIILNGRPGQAPGAGGGGAGAEGAGAVGGEGGGGGEFVEAWFSADDLPETVEVKVGRGGRGVLGGDGMDGEDSAFGNLLRAKGGKGGRVGRSEAQPRQSQESPSIRVASAIFANSAECRDGLLYILGGGWNTYYVQTVPGILIGCLVLLFDVDRIAGGASHDLQFELVDQNGDSKCSCPIVIHLNGLAEVVRVPQIVTMQVDIESAGMWIARISSGKRELARIPLRIQALPDR